MSNYWPFFSWKKKMTRKKRKEELNLSNSPSFHVFQVESYSHSYSHSSNLPIVLLSHSPHPSCPVNPSFKHPFIHSSFCNLGCFPLILLFCSLSLYLPSSHFRLSRPRSYLPSAVFIPSNPPSSVPSSFYSSVIFPHVTHSTLPVLHPSSVTCQHPLSEPLRSNRGGKRRKLGLCTSYTLSLF